MKRACVRRPKTSILGKLRGFEYSAHHHTLKPGRRWRGKARKEGEGRKGSKRKEGKRRKEKDGEW